MRNGLLVACLLTLCSFANAHAAKQASDDWQMLFDGKTLTGWRASEAPGSFSVHDGAIVVRGPRSHLYYLGPVQRHDFRNFELQLEVMTRPGANSGVYFHTAWQDEGWPARGYEVQVNNSQSDPKRTAGLYGIKDNYQAPAKDGVWFTLRIRVEGRRIRTFVDDKSIIDYTQPTATRATGRHARPGAVFGYLRAAGARSGQRSALPQHQGARAAVTPFVPVPRRNGMNPQRLFVASCIALLATAMSFAIRGDIMGELELAFGLDKVQLGWISGAAFWGFGLSILFGGTLCDLLGMGRLLKLAAVGHIAGVLLTVFATDFTMLFAATVLIGVANGFVEAGINPLIATLYRNDKTARLVKLHAWFPGGIVVGGVLAFAFTQLGLGWQSKMLLMLLPSAIYATMFFAQRFPGHRTQGGGSFRRCDVR